MNRKELELELGRYKKRCDDLMKINRELSEKVKGIAAVNMLVEAFRIQVALTYGEAAIDPDTGEEIGRRLTIPAYDARELTRKYEAHTRKEDGKYIMGIGLKDDPRDKERETH